jgi:hypothetical protein
LRAPLKIYLDALKENKNIIHITFGEMNSDFRVDRFLSDLPWVTSISWDRAFSSSKSIHRDHPGRFIRVKDSNTDLNTFAENFRPKLSDNLTYIFMDDGGSNKWYSESDRGKFAPSPRVLISFVAPTFGQNLILRVKHSGEDDRPLEVTLGSTKVQLKPPSKSSLTIDDITLTDRLDPIHVLGPSGSDLLFIPEIRNDIFIQFIGPDKERWHGHILHDIELLDEGRLEYMPHSASFV